MEDRGLVQEEQKVERPEEEKKPEEASVRVEATNQLIPPGILPSFDLPSNAPNQTQQPE